MNMANNTAKGAGDDDMGLISPRAEVFRAKLIADFNLLDTITEAGAKIDAPKYTTVDLLDDAKKKTLLETNPHALVRLEVYSMQTVGGVDIDRRQKRVRNTQTKNPAIDIWAHWVVESSFFQNSVLILILMNSIVLGVQGELGSYEGEAVERAKLGLDIFDYCTMVVYMIEIFLKWIDDFWGFWKNRWNIFDFCVTFLFLIPEIINLSAGDFGQLDSKSDITVIANNLRTFRILRSLKMVSRFQKVRLIILAVTKAFQAMVFITVLLLLFAYIFAIIGVMFFKESYINAGSTEDPKELKYSDSFTSIGTALLTLFQLFTLDHWLAVYKDLMSIADPYFGSFYIILWIVIGSFIFRNIFAGIMVNNFQNIRKDLFQEVDDILQQELHEVEMQQFVNEMDRQRTSHMDLRTDELAYESRGGEQHEESEWEEVVRRHLQTLAREDTQLCWPKDTLFQYYLMMEALQENLRERQELLILLNEALLSIHDD